MPAPPNSEKITGATRYRENWLGRLILQVEHYTDDPRMARSPRCDGTPPPRSTGWRDAASRDLISIRYFERKDFVSPPPKRED